DDDERVARDAAADEHLVLARIDANGDVETLRDQIDVAVLGDDLELDGRIAANELRGERPEHELPEHQRHADTQLAARLQRPFRETLADLEDLGEQRARALVQRAAVLRERERARAALEETHAEAFLERRHATR